MATVGPGSPSQLFGVLFKSMAGVDLVTVNYRGIGPALLDLISGRVEVIFASIASTIEYIRSGKLRPLAVTTAQRIDLLPDVPSPTRWGSAEMAAHFPGFHHIDMRTSGAIIRLRHGGSGPPLLLVHGNPENH